METIFLRILIIVLISLIVIMLYKMFSKEIIKYVKIKIQNMFEDDSEDLADLEAVKKPLVLPETAFDDKNKVNDIDDNVSLAENTTNDLIARLKSCEQNTGELDEKLKGKEIELVDLQSQNRNLIKSDEANFKLLAEKDNIILAKTNLIEEQQKEIELLKNKENPNSIPHIESQQKFDLKNKTCIVQSLISAGPRKSDRDTELGEDCSGFILKDDELYFWVLDGTSDESIIFIDEIETFSCRILAVQLSQTISMLVTDKSFELVELLVDESINIVMNEWQKQVDEEYIKTQRLGREINTFKTTLLIGKCNINTGVLQSFRIGDSNMLAFDKNNNKLDVFGLEYKDQVTLQINEDDGRFLVRKFDNSETIQKVTLKNVTKIVAFSDGISRSTERELINNINRLDKIILNKKQNTQDDKAMIYIQILEE